MLLAFLAIISGIAEEMLARERVRFCSLGNACGAGRSVVATENGGADKTSAQCRHQQLVGAVRGFHAPNLPGSVLGGNLEWTNGRILLAEHQLRLGKIVCPACTSKVKSRRSQHLTAGLRSERGCSPGKNGRWPGFF